MAVTIKLKNASGSDPNASDLVVGELAIRTDTAKLFTKKDNGSVVEILGSTGGGLTNGDKGDITVANNGDTLTVDNGVINNAKVASDAAIAGTKIDPDFGSQTITSKNIQASGHAAITGTPHTYKYGRGDNAGGLSIYANEPAIEAVGTDSSNHAASVLLRVPNRGAGFVYNPTDNALELKLFTTSANSFTIHGSGTNVSDIDTQLRVVKNAQVELAHNGSVKLATSSSGVDVTGDITGTGNLTLTSTDAGSSASPIIEFYRNSASPADADYLGQLKFTGENDNGSKKTYAKITGKIDDVSSGTIDGLIEFMTVKAGSNNICARLTSTALKLQNGTNLEFPNGGQIKLGDSDDLQLFHDGSTSRIQDSYGHLLIGSNIIELKTGALNETYISCVANGAVTIKHDNTTRIATTSAGADVTGQLNVSDLTTITRTSSSGNDPILKVLHSNLTQGIALGYNTIAAIGSNTNVDLRLESKGTGLIYLIDNANAQTINVATNSRINFASNNRLSIVSNGTNSYLDYAGTLNVRGSSGSASALSFLSDSNVLVSNNLEVTGDLTIDTNTLHVDSANNRVGIGTTSPSIALEITKNTQSGIKITDQAVTDASFEIRPQTGNTTKLFRIIDSTASADRLTINASGTVNVAGSITLGGTVDGVDIAARDTLFGGLTSSSGVLTNGVTATTQSAGDNSTKVATTAYTDTAISNLVDSSPSTLNTLNELAAALGDDANFSTTVTNSIATKLPLAGGTLTGNLTIETTEPEIFLKDSNNNDDFTVRNNNGVFTVRDATNGADRFTIASNGRATLKNDVGIDGNLDVGNGIDVTGNISTTGNVTTSGEIFVSSTYPRIHLTDTNNDSDYLFVNDNGNFRIYDNTNSAARLSIDAGGTTNIAGNLDVGSGIDVTGAINGTGDLTITRPINTNNTLTLGGSGAYSTFIKLLCAGAGGTQIEASGRTDGGNKLEIKIGSNVVGFFDESDFSVKGDILLTGDATTTNQNRMIKFTGFDKEGTTDFTDNAFIRHTTNTGGLAGSVLEIGSLNDSNDGIAFNTNTHNNNLRLNGNIIWNAGNDGSGSGLDADTVDGIQGSSFLRSDANDTSSGTIAFGAGTLDPDSFASFSGGFGGISDGSGWGARGLFVHGGGTGDAAAIAHNGSNLYFGIQNGSSANSMETWLQVAPGTRVVNFQTDNNATNVQIGGNKIFHAGNDGSGSGLDADLLDGVQGSSFVRSDANDGISGFITITNDSGIKILSSTNGAGSKIQFSDNASGSYAQNGTLTYKHSDGAVTTTGGNSNDGWLFEGSETRTVVKVVGDIEATSNIYGAGSNITALNASNISSGTIPAARLSASDLLTLIKTVDGAGSGLDADTIDGYQQAELYRQTASASATVGAGWMTVAENTNGRFHGEIFVSDSESGDHSFIRIDWMRSYKDSCFTVINCGGHTNRITGVRVLRDNDEVYGNKKLQVYVTVNSPYRVAIKSFQNQTGWGNHSVVTPVVQASISGYSVEDSALESLDTYAFSNNQGIQAGSGGIKSLGNVDITGNITASGTLDTGNATLNRADVTVVTDGSRNNGVFIEAGDTGAGNRPNLVLKGAGSAGLSQEAIQVYYNNGSNKTFDLDYEGNIEARSITLTNDGAGSGLDADLLDGLQASSFLRSDADDTATGQIKLQRNSTDNTDFSLHIRNSQSARAQIKFTNNSTTQNGFFYYRHEDGQSNSAGNSFHFDSTETSTAVIIDQTSGLSGFYVGTNKVWHQGNDGSGSGLDADTVDGLQASSFLRSDVHDTQANQRIEFNACDTNNYDTIATATGNQGAIEIRNTGVGNDAFIALHAGGDFACYFGLDADINDIAVGGWSMGSSKYRIWHQGNDGTGSGLDADTVDGIQASSFLRSDAGDTATGKLTVRDIQIQAGYHLQRSDHHTGHLEGSYNNVGANSYKSNPIYTIGSSYNPADASLGNMYGVGFTHTNSSFISFTGASNWGLYVAADGDARVWLGGSNGVISSTGQHYVGSNVVWNAGNDGAGSGLDADLLDGVQGTNYAQKTGATFTGDCTFSGSAGAITLSAGSDIRSSAGTWTGDTNKIQWHSSHLYFQSSDRYIFRKTNGTEVLYIDGSGNLVADGDVTAYSDIKLKTNIKTIDNALNMCNQMRGVFFDWKASGDSSIGVIAQEIEKVIPQIVHTNENTDPLTGVVETIKSVDYGKVTSVLINAINELTQKVKELENKLNVE